MAGMKEKLIEVKESLMSTAYTCTDNKSTHADASVVLVQIARTSAYITLHTRLQLLTFMQAHQAGTVTG